MQHACVGAVNSRLREGDLVRYFIGEVCPLCLHVGTTSDAWIPAIVWKVSSTHIWIRYQYISYCGWYYRRTKRHRYWVKCFPRNTRLIRPEFHFPDHFLFSSKLSHETRAKIILHSGSCPLRKWRKQFFRRVHRSINQTEERWRKPLHVFGSKENDEEDEDSFWELEGEGFYYLKEADGQPPRWECYFGEEAGDDDQDQHEEEEEEGEEDTYEEDGIEANEEQKENNEKSSAIRGKKSLPSKRWERKGKANRRGRKMVG
ncbi:hypothetical protein QOT17_016745 [Balamuthia mandrillaris]